jgi:hypothetical protein
MSTGMAELHRIRKAVQQNQSYSLGLNFLGLKFLGLNFLGLISLVVVPMAGKACHGMVEVGFVMGTGQPWSRSGDTQRRDS